MGLLVPLTGLEPVRGRPQGILSPWCLPIPPQRHIQLDCAFFVLLRCPTSSSAFKSLPHLSTAATRSAPFFRPRRRSPRSPWCLPIPPQRHIQLDCAFFVLLRCPTSSSAFKSLPHLSSLRLRTMVLRRGCRYSSTFLGVRQGFWGDGVAFSGKFSKNSCKFDKNDVE